jgi:flagellar hook-basal body complex protein FliE
MAISPLGPIASSALTRLDPTKAASAAGGDGFSKAVTSALESVNTQQAKADELANQAALGKVSDPQEYMIAATEASLSTELTVAVRNRAVEAFNEIMRMTL